MKADFSKNRMQIQPPTTAEAKLKIDSAGGAVRALREQAGLSLQELAERVGWDKGRLSKYENNHLGLSLSALDELAAGLGVPSTTLLIDCLKHRYPSLNHPQSRVGRLLDQLTRELDRTS